MAMAKPAHAPWIFTAIESGDDVKINAFFTIYNDVNMTDPATGRTLVHTAVSSGNIKVLDMLLSRGANINVSSSDKRTPLHIAVEKQSTKMVEMLLNNGAYVNPESNCNNKTPLYLAVELNCLRIAEMLLSTGASIKRASMGNKTLFEIAQKNGNTFMCQLLSEYFQGQLTWPENSSDKASQEAKITQPHTWSNWVGASSAL